MHRFWLFIFLSQSVLAMGTHDVFFSLGYQSGIYVPKEVQAACIQFMIKDVLHYIERKGEVICNMVCSPDQKPGVLYQDDEVRVVVARSELNLMGCTIFCNGERRLSPILPMKGCRTSSGSYYHDYRVDTACTESEMKVQIRSKKNTRKLVHWLKYNLLLEQAAVIKKIFDNRDSISIQLFPYELGILSTIPSNIGEILKNHLLSDTFYTYFMVFDEPEDKQPHKKCCCNCTIL